KRKVDCILQCPAITTTGILINTTWIQLNVVRDMVLWLIVTVCISKHAISIAALQEQALNRLDLQISVSIKVVVQSLITTTIQHHLSYRVVQTWRNGCQSVFNQVRIHKQFTFFIIYRNKWITCQHIANVIVIHTTYSNTGSFTEPVIQSLTNFNYIHITFLIDRVITVNTECVLVIVRFDWATQNTFLRRIRET